MTENEQIEAFARELSLVIERYRNEFNLCVASAIGVLETIKLELFLEQAKAHDKT